MEGPRLEEVRLTSFKSFTGQRLPLQDLTVLIGRNGSGKSNALDALMVLARLASGESVRDALDGREDSVRGGVEGCAPLGEDSFQIGCRVRQGEAVFDLDVEVEVRPEVRIVREDLVAVEGVSYGNRRLAGRPLLLGGYGHGRYGVGRVQIVSAADRLLISQLPPAQTDSATKAEQLVNGAAHTVLTALREVFLLDPVPHLMRSYVNERDSELRRSADNLSAVVARLAQSEPDAFHRLTDLVAGMPEYLVKGVGFVDTPLGDVQLLLSESGYHGADHEVPARLLSDGMLRFLAFGTAFLSSRRHLVIEEIENGLYPTQAARVLDLMKEETRRRRIDVLFTTHSPALLNSLTADDHSGVIVCSRDPGTGESLLTPLPELPGYVDLLAAGDLGDAVAEGRLPDAWRNDVRRASAA
ncbi:AAA family ATPase [Streptomyces sp. 4F14]|uniref:AAA family ATPase n=1 Tax=Streptomyces sp. 4F14 TaxID=3394380 RepID=UPI003A8C60B4